MQPHRLLTLSYNNKIFQWKKKKLKKVKKLKKKYFQRKNKIKIRRINQVLYINNTYFKLQKKKKKRK